MSDTVRVRMDATRPEHCRRGLGCAVVNGRTFVCVCGPEMRFTPIALPETVRSAA